MDLFGSRVPPKQPLLSSEDTREQTSIKHHEGKEKINLGGITCYLVAINDKVHINYKPETLKEIKQKIRKKIYEEEKLIKNESTIEDSRKRGKIFSMLRPLNLLKHVKTKKQKELELQIKHLEQQLKQELNDFLHNKQCGTITFHGKDESKIPVPDFKKREYKINPYTGEITIKTPEDGEIGTGKIDFINGDITIYSMFETKSETKECMTNGRLDILSGDFKITDYVQHCSWNYWPRKDYEQTFNTEGNIKDLKNNRPDLDYYEHILEKQNIRYVNDFFCNLDISKFFRISEFYKLHKNDFLKLKELRKQKHKF